MAALCFCLTFVTLIAAWQTPPPRTGRPAARMSTAAVGRPAVRPDEHSMRRQAPRGRRRVPPAELPLPVKGIDQARFAAMRGNATRAIELAVQAIDSPPGAQDELVRGCNKLLAVLGDHGELPAMERLYGAMLRSTLKPTQITYGTLISRAGNVGKPKRALYYYHEMQKRGIHPDTKTVNSMINAFAKVGDVERAFAVAASMQRRALTPTVVTYNSLIDACARTGNLTGAHDALRQMAAARIEPNVRTYSIMIHLCARGARADEAFEWLERMHAAGLSPNAVTLSALMNACGRAGRLTGDHGAFRVLADMQRLGLTPNVITYTTLIDACAKGRELGRALAVFREMNEKGVAPNSVTCHALFNGCLQQGELLLAREVLGHMASVGMRPSAHSFTALLSAASREGASAVASACLLRQMVKPAAAPAAQQHAHEPAAAGGAAEAAEAEDGVALDASLAAIFGRSQKLEQALTVLDTLHTARLRPPPAVWQQVFDGVDTAAELEDALRRFERSRGDDGAGVGEATYAALLGACARARRVPQAIDVCEQMAAAGVAPSEESVEQLMLACAQLADGDAALQLLGRLRTAGVAPSASGLTSLLAALSDSGGGARTLQPFLSDAAAPAAQPLLAVFEVFNEMRAAGVKADAAAFNAMINACADAGDAARAEGAFGEMLAAGLAPDVISYTSLIKAHAARADAARAEQLFQEMQQRTNHVSSFVEPSERTFRHMMAVSLAAADAARVLELLDDMRHRRLAPSAAHYSLALQACALPSVCDLPLSLQRAATLYEQLRDEGLRLDTRGLLALDRLCSRHNRPELAQRARRERSIPPWPRGARPAGPRIGGPGGGAL